MTLPELKQLPTQEEVDALKAQVNRFKHGVESFNKTGSMNELLSAYIETPKQCLDKHDAKLRMQLDCALKAQVNCLREELKILSIGLGFSLCHGDGVIKRSDIKKLIGDVDKALEATPEQYLAKVKAKAIEGYKRQIAESKQLDLATKS